jgi:two-component system, response regulator PdtaR
VRLHSNWTVSDSGNRILRLRRLAASSSELLIGIKPMCRRAGNAELAGYSGRARTPVDSRGLNVSATTEHGRPIHCFHCMIRQRQDTILVVEDEPVIRMMAAGALTENGFQVFEATDAAEALFVLSMHPRIDLLFTDVNMPGRMDGLGLAVRAIEGKPDLRLIVTSGRERFSDSSLPDHGKFLMKPYDGTQLVELVRRELSTSH